MRVATGAHALTLVRVDIDVFMFIFMIMVGKKCVFLSQHNIMFHMHRGLWPDVSSLSLSREREREAMTVVMANFFFYVLIYLGPTTGKRLKITLCEHILLLCVGVTTECDTWNSDVENEQPRILI